jgi:hypothetical protein
MIGNAAKYVTTFNYIHIHKYDRRQKIEVKQIHVYVHAEPKVKSISILRT